MATEGGGVYFPVDAGFCDTMVAEVVTEELGDAGFHAYVRLLCSLLNEPGGRLPLQMEVEWRILSRRVGLGIDQTRELVGLMEHYGALERYEDGSVYSPLVSASIAARNQTREVNQRRARAGAEARWKKQREREGKGKGDAQADA